MDLSKVALVVCHRGVVSDDDQESWLWDLSQRVWDPGIIVELFGYCGYGGEVASPVSSSGRSRLVDMEVWLLGLSILSRFGLSIYGL